MKIYKILIAESEYLSRYVINLLISNEFKNNVLILQAENGIKAKQIIDTQPIDIAIIDMNILGIKGIELCKYIRIKYNDLPIIATTTYYDNQLSEKILKLNISEYMVKPIKLSHIIDVLNKYIKDSINDNDVITKQNNYLKQISKSIIRGEYKTTIDIIKNYINYLYTESIMDYEMKEIKVLGKTIELLGNKTKSQISCSVQGKIYDIIENPSNYSDMNETIIEFTNIINEIFIDTNEDEDVNYNSYIKEAINYVEKNIKKNITLDEVANFINITPHYLSKIFKKEVGINFVTYITNKKISLAKKMLKDEEMPIVNIAVDLSFNHPNYFSKVFKQKVGITPSEYRESYLHNR